jgi:hypothetical protein
VLIKSSQRELKEDPNKIDRFRIFSDISIAATATRPEKIPAQKVKLDNVSRVFISLRTSFLAPSEVVLAFCDSILAPSEDVLAFCEEILAPSEEILAFCEEILAFCEEILAPSEDVLAFTDILLAPSEEILAFTDKMAVARILMYCCFSRINTGRNAIHSKNSNYACHLKF